MNLFAESIQLKRLPDFNSVPKLLRNNVKLYSRTQALEWVLHEGRWRNPQAWRSLFHHRSADAMLTGLINVCVCVCSRKAVDQLRGYTHLSPLHPPPPPHGQSAGPGQRRSQEKKSHWKKKKDRRAHSSFHNWNPEFVLNLLSFKDSPERAQANSSYFTLLVVMVTWDHSAGFTLNVSIFFFQNNTPGLLWAWLGEHDHCFEFNRFFAPDWYEEVAKSCLILNLWDSSSVFFLSPCSAAAPTMLISSCYVHSKEMLTHRPISTGVAGLP